MRSRVADGAPRYDDTIATNRLPRSSHAVVWTSMLDLVDETMRAGPDA